MALAKWMCSRNTKQMFVKIVHPGGHIELHDGPVLASEIINRNPKCCVARPDIFKQPWAILAPETTLMPGQKFYVVPRRTVRRLQSLALKKSPSAAQEIKNLKRSNDEGESNGDVSSCLSFRRLENGKNKNGEGCFTRFLTGISSEDKSEETRSSSSKNPMLSEKKTLSRNRSVDSAAETEISPNRLSSFDNWQPGLESIVEE